jgi:aryl-alcohol dehydrogenase-like predicted oxidoreductase
MLCDMAAEMGVKQNQLALAWLLHHEPRVIPIVGASSLGQLNQNLAALTIELRREQCTHLSMAGE